VRAVEESTIDRRGLVALYILYQLTWTIAMFYAWPEGYRLPPIAPPAPMMIQVASCLFFAAALFGDQLVVRILLASAYAAMAFEAVWNQISGAPRHRRHVLRSYVCTMAWRFHAIDAM